MCLNMNPCGVLNRRVDALDIINMTMNIIRVFKAESVYKKSKYPSHPSYETN